MLRIQTDFSLWYWSHPWWWKRTWSTEKSLNCFEVLNTTRVASGRAATNNALKGFQSWKNRKNRNEIWSSPFFYHLSFTFPPMIYVAVVSGAYFPNHWRTAKDLPFCSRIFPLSTKDFNKCASLENKNKVFTLKGNRELRKHHKHPVFQPPVS